MEAQGPSGVGGAVTEKQHLRLEYRCDSVASNLKHLFYVRTNADRKSKTEMLHEFLLCN